MSSVPSRQMPTVSDLIREGFRSFVKAEKAVIESVTKRPEAKEPVDKGVRRVKRTRAPKPRAIPVTA